MTPTIAPVRHDDIAVRAYFLWEAEGRPEGRHETHWLTAEAAEKRSLAGRRAAATRRSRQDAARTAAAVEATEKSTAKVAAKAAGKATSDAVVAAAAVSRAASARAARRLH